MAREAQSWLTPNRFLSLFFLPFLYELSSPWYAQQWKDWPAAIRREAGKECNDADQDHLHIREQSRNAFHFLCSARQWSDWYTGVDSLGGEHRKRERSRVFFFSSFSLSRPTNNKTKRENWGVRTKKKIVKRKRLCGHLSSVSATHMISKSSTLDSPQSTEKLREHARILWWMTLTQWIRKELRSSIRCAHTQFLCSFSVIILWTATRKQRYKGRPEWWNRKYKSLRSTDRPRRVRNLQLRDCPRQQLIDDHSVIVGGTVLWGAVATGRPTHGPASKKKEEIRIWTVRK